MDFDAIITGIRKAIYGREVREYIASSMEWTRDFVNQSITNIKELLRQAEAAQDAAKTSETNAKASETNAKASENAAKASRNAAASSASAAAGSASAAKTSETNAKASENEARQLVEAAKKVVNTDKTLTIDGAPADAKTVGDKFKSIKTDWNSVTDKPETFPPSEHNHSKLAFEHGNEVNFVGTPDSHNVYFGYRDSMIEEYRFAKGQTKDNDYADIRANKFIGSLDGGVTDYNSSGHIIKIGYVGDGLNTSNLTHIAGYTDNGAKIKDVSKAVLQSWLGVTTITSQTSDPGAGSSLATGTILLVYA